MIVSCARPYFCPYPGYFAPALASDVFVVLDDVQFPLGSTWTTRNRFKNDQGAFWMGVPVWKKGLGLQSIREVKISHEGRWRRKHLASLSQAYLHAPYLHEHMGIFERMFSSSQESLCEMNTELIAYVLAELGAKARLVRMSETGVTDRGTQLLVEICRRLGAKSYLAGDASRKWIDTGLFEDAGIDLVFMKAPSPVYPQLWGGIVQNLSVFDLLFNCGPRSRAYLLPGSRPGA